MGVVLSPINPVLFTVFVSADNAGFIDSMKTVVTDAIKKRKCIKFDEKIKNKKYY